MSGSPSKLVKRYRIYIVKDIILKLVEYGELNQTAAVSFSGLSLKKHKPTLDNLQQHDMIQREGAEEAIGKRAATLHRPT
jgi:predicted transcriptional regulator